MVSLIINLLIFQLISTGTLGLKKETPQIYKVEPAVAYEEMDDELDPEIFNKILNLSCGILI